MSLPEIKIITLGECSVGKSSLIIKYVNDTFSSNYISTLGLDFRQKKIELEDGKEINLRLFDTAGQERYKSISANFIKKANGILLIYDITNKASFNSISKWMESIEEISPANTIVIIVGNKIDLETERQVTREEGVRKAKEYDIPFYETSCKSGININQVFTRITKEILNKNENNNNGKGEILTHNTKKNKKSTCC